MGTITLSITGDVSVGTKTKTYTVADADINRLVAIWKTRANTVVNGTATVAQACVVWADSVIAQAKSDVVTNEKQVTVAAVADPVWVAT